MTKEKQFVEMKSTSLSISLPKVFRKTMDYPFNKRLLEHFHPCDCWCTKEGIGSRRHHLHRILACRRRYSWCTVYYRSSVGHSNTRDIGVGHGNRYTIATVCITSCVEIGGSAISGFYTGEIYGCLRFLERSWAPKTKSLSEKVGEVGLRGYFWITEKARSKSLSVHARCVSLPSLFFSFRN